MAFIIYAGAVPRVMEAGRGQLGRLRHIKLRRPNFKASTPNSTLNQTLKFNPRCAAFIFSSTGAWTTASFRLNLYLTRRDQVRRSVVSWLVIQPFLLWDSALQEGHISLALVSRINRCAPINWNEVPCRLTRFFLSFRGSSKRYLLLKNLDSMSYSSANGPLNQSIDGDEFP